MNAELPPSAEPAPAAGVDRCLHCAQPVPRGNQSGFCCTGCARVHDLLRDSGLDRYYALRGATALSPIGEQPARAIHAWLDALEQQQPASQGVRRFALDVQGVQCGACVWLIEALFRRLGDAYRIELNPALGRMRLQVGPQFSVRELVHQVEQFGYRLGPESKSSAGASTDLVLRTGVCLALAGNTMFLSATTYLGLSEGPLHALVQNAIFALTTVTALVGGSYFVERAYRGLKRGVLHLDLPIAIGLTLAYAGSVWSLYSGRSDGSYLDTVSVFIALMLLGRLLQERLVERNRRQLLASDGASGLLTRRIIDGRTELIPCPQVKPGDQLLICPGEIIPVRSTLRDAEAACSLDWINGESEPRSVSGGAELVGGAINAGDGAITVTALDAFERSDLDDLLRDDPVGRTRAAGDFWDRLSRVYVWLVLVATAVGAGLWWSRGADLHQVLDVATAVLVVTCPCAFGIATPLAYELTTAALRRRGLFVRDGSFFDRAAQVKRIVFDKTGTLTTGALVLRRPETLASLTAHTRRVLYDLSARSNHPKSVAIVRALQAAFPEVRMGDAQVTEVKGLGLSLWRDGVCFRLGAPRWAAPGAGGAVGPVFSAGGLLLADLPTAEVTRQDARDEVQALRGQGLELWIASGDRQDRVDAVADALAIARARARGDLDPEGKQKLIASLDEGDTLMLGDGINDGPALARAHCAGTPAVDRPFVPARTDFYYLSPGLLPVRIALSAARHVRRVVRINLSFAAAYNVGAVALCYAGVMRPWLAAVLMPASSLLVLTYTAIALSARRKLWKS